MSKDSKETASIRNAPSKHASSKHASSKNASTIIKHITIFGFEGCGYYNAALEKLEVYIRRYNTSVIKYKLKLVKHCVNRIMWPSVVQKYATNAGLSHTTSPLIFFESTYIGGHDALVLELAKQKPFGV